MHVKSKQNECQQQISNIYVYLVQKESFQSLFKANRILYPISILIPINK